MEINSCSDESHMLPHPLRGKVTFLFLALRAGVLLVAKAPYINLLAPSSLHILKQCYD